MDSYFVYMASFLKDACVLVVLAYLLARGRMLRLLFRERLSRTTTLLLGTCLGVIGLTEALIPQAGFQYAIGTLCIAFAASIGGSLVGLIAAGIIILGTALRSLHGVPGLLAAVVVTIPLAHIIRRTPTTLGRLLGGFVVGALTQATHLLVRYLFGALWALPALPSTSLLSIPVNGFGLALLLLVISDAQVRADSEFQHIEIQRQRAETERARTLASEAQLAALRTRIHPHFLFNALNSISELCYIAPKRAEAASLNLASLMRRALETSAATTISLREEIALTRSYLQIEQERFGDCLRAEWQIEEGYEETPIVPFALQVLVENAIKHGLKPLARSGTVTIIVRGSARRTLVAVLDNGVGMEPEARLKDTSPDEPLTHGLPILNQQLVLCYGQKARLRFFSQKTRGTLSVFALPHIPESVSLRKIAS